MALTMLKRFGSFIAFAIGNKVDGWIYKKAAVEKKYGKVSATNPGYSDTGFKPGPENPYHKTDTTATYKLETKAQYQ